MVDSLVSRGDIVKVGGDSSLHVLFSALKQQALFLTLITTKDIVLNSVFKHDHIDALVMDGVGSVTETTFGKIHHLAIELRILG